MNERIRELLKQSTNPPWDGEQGPMNEFNLEKFAGLIVQECADAAGEWYMNHNDIHWDPATHILQRFGVEE